MRLEIKQREREGIVILDLEGSLLLGQESKLRRSLRRLRRAANTAIAFNLQGVGKIDGTGLGTLLVAHEELRRAGGRLVLFHLKPLHLELLLLTKLVTVFELFVDEQDAVNSFLPREVHGTL
jgi:anti-sigma B factor antagonist